MIAKIKKNIFLTFFLTAIALLFLFTFSDFNKVTQSFASFPITTFLLSVLFSIASLIVKFFRWHYYVRLLKLQITIRDSILYFTSGLTMSISPGKWGELIKSYLIKQKYRIPISKSAPIIFAERIIEFIALILITIMGVIIYEFSSSAIYICGFLIVVFILLLKNKKVVRLVMRTLIKLPFLKKYKKNIDDLLNNSNKLFAIKPLASMTLLSIIAWILESFGFYIILSNFINNISVFWATFNYAISIILGAFSMLPGGIGVTEGSLTYLLTQKGLSNSNAAAATIIVRVVTLWLSVIIGIAAFMVISKSSEINLDKISSVGNGNAEIQEN